MWAIYTIGKGNGTLIYTLSFGVRVSEKVGFYIEPYGEWTDFKAYLSNFDAGFTYLVKDNLQLDFSFGTGINYTMNYIAAGVSWNFAKE